MSSPRGERAIDDASRYGRAILKFVSPNDVGLTGSHQCGFYLPKDAWKIYTPHPPTKGINHKHAVTILWPDGRETDSRVTWYGRGTRSEYRLTRFGPDFPYLAAGNVGDLLVLVPKSTSEFIAYVLDLDEDIEEIQAALDVQVLGSWGVYGEEAPERETENACLDRLFRTFAASIEQLPQGYVFSGATRDAVAQCVKGFSASSVDDRLMRLVKEEYKLYKMVERKVNQDKVERLFASIDDFLQTALRILNARKSRAGRSLENHVESLLKNANVPFEVRQVLDGTRPDIIIPSKAAYEDASVPEEKLFVVGIKTTCKDR